MKWNDVLKLRLRNAPGPVKALALAYLTAISLAYVYAVGNIALVVGLTPKAIAIHYYGAAEKVVETKTTTGEEELDLDSDTVEKKADLGPRPNFKNLVAAGHFHLFGMSSFFFGLTLLVLFTGLSNLQKVVLICMTYGAIIVDNVSFMVTRFGGPQFAYLTAVAGTFMGLCFTALWLAIVIETIKKTEEKI